MSNIDVISHLKKKPVSYSNNFVVYCYSNAKSALIVTLPCIGIYGISNFYSKKALNAIASTVCTFHLGINDF